MKKYLLGIVAICLIFSIGGCDDHPDWQDDIHVPFFESITGNSAAHCVAMWSAYDDRWVSESVIADTMSCLSGLDCINAIESGINNYTGSIAWISDTEGSDAGFRS
jgi:hypothetical protein